MGKCERRAKVDGRARRTFQMPARGGRARAACCADCLQRRCCEDCAHIIRPGSHWLRIILSRWVGLLLCLNREDCPGVISETWRGGTCRNFRPRCRAGERAIPPKPPNENVRYIPLTRNLFAMVDAEDFEELNKHKWFAQDGRHTFYAARHVGKRTLTMHRVIMKPAKGMVVDHIDGNGLNNCKSNLRICTPAQNNLNTRARDSRCGLKGVHYLKRNKTNKYGAAVNHKGKRTHGGAYATAVEAALARDRLAREIQGEHAFLNFPDGPPLDPEPAGNPPVARR